MTQKLGIVLSGFNKFPAENAEDKNRGITEGYTEMIASYAIPGTLEVSSGYYITAMLINQIIFLIGKDCFLRPYFSNTGISPIKNELDKIWGEPHISYVLFRTIESYYNTEYSNNKQFFLYLIQSNILDYLDRRLEKLKMQNRIKEINEICRSYSSMLITSDILSSNGKNPENYIGIDKNLNNFQRILDKYTVSLSGNENPINNGGDEQGL